MSTPDKRGPCIRSSDLATHFGLFPFASAIRRRGGRPTRGRDCALYGRGRHLHYHVIAQLHALFYDLEQSVRFLINPIGAKGEKPTRRERLKEAGDRFREAQRYYQHNSLWLDDDICKKVEVFWDRMYEIWEEFEIIGMALGMTGFEEVDQQEWREVYEELFGKERPQKGWRELHSRVANEVPQLKQ